MFGYSGVPEFSEIATHQSSRFMDAGIYKYYRSNANYENVKRFYFDTLTEKGWMPVEQSYLDREAQKPVSFKKGPFEVVLEHSTSASSNYAVNFLWRCTN